MTDAPTTTRPTRHYYVLDAGLSYGVPLDGVDGTAWVSEHAMQGETVELVESEAERLTIPNRHGMASVVAVDDVLPYEQWRPTFIASLAAKRGLRTDLVSVGGEANAEATHKAVIDALMAQDAAAALPKKKVTK